VWRRFALRTAGSHRVFDDEHLQVAVVDEDVYPLRHVVHELGIGDVNEVVCGLVLCGARHLHTFAGLEVYGLCADGGAHFRPLGVHQDGDAIGDGTGVVDNLVESLAGHVCGVHAHYVHTRFEQVADKFYFAALVGDRRYNLGLLQ
jgi:hypothetical protein